MNKIVEEEDDYYNSFGIKEKDINKIIWAIKSGSERKVIDTLPFMYAEEGRLLKLKFYIEYGLVDDDKKNFEEVQENIKYVYHNYLECLFNSFHLRELVSDIESKFEGNFKNLLRAIFLGPIEYDCEQLHKAMEGFGTNEDTLIEILGTRPKRIIEKIKAQYEIMYPEKTLDEDIKNNTSGYFRGLLVSILEAKSIIKEKHIGTIERNIDKLSRGLHISSWGRNRFFKKIFTKGKEGLLSKIDENKKNSLKVLIDKFYSFNTRKLLKACFYRETDPYKFFAKKIHKALSGLFRVDANLLTRVIITQFNRGREFYSNIEFSYTDMYQSDLVEDIEKKCDDSFGRLLKEIIF